MSIGRVTAPFVRFQFVVSGDDPGGQDLGVDNHRRSADILASDRQLVVPCNVPAKNGPNDDVAD